MSYTESGDNAPCILDLSSLFVVGGKLHALVPGIHWREIYDSPAAGLDTSNELITLLALSYTSSQSPNIVNKMYQ
jgi:hypothetical protein